MVFTTRTFFAVIAVYKLASGAVNGGIKLAYRTSSVSVAMSAAGTQITKFAVHTVVTVIVEPPIV